MSRWLLFLLSLSHCLIPFVIADQPWSYGTGLITLNLTNGPVYFPNDSDFPQSFKPQQRCTWSFSVPQGQYAQVGVNMGLTSGDSLSISTDKGYNHQTSRDIPKSGKLKFFVPEGNAQLQFIAVNIDGNGTFSFSVQLHDLSEIPATSVDSDEVQKVLSLESLRGKQTAISRSDLFTLRTIVNQCNTLDYRYDTCLVYEGSSASSGMFIAGLSQYVSGRVTNFLGDVTVVCFEYDVPPGSLLLVAPTLGCDTTFSWQVSTNCSFFQTTNEGSPEYFTDYTPDGSPKYLQSANTTLYGQATLSIYSDIYQPLTSELATYYTPNSRYYFPQKVDGVWKTIRTQGGAVNFTMTEDSTDWDTVTYRSGFFASQSYGISSYYQNANTTFNCPKQCIYGYSLKKLYSGSIRILIDLGNGAYYNRTITKSSKDSQLVDDNIYGYNMFLEYISDSGKPTKGGLLYFWLFPGGVAGTSVFLIITFVLALFS